MINNRPEKPANEPTKRNIVLCKFGRREHLEQLRNGLLYMQTLSYFAALEHDELRADPFEGTTFIAQPRDIGSIALQVPQLSLSTTIRPSDLAAPTTFSPKENACNVFCMLAIDWPASYPSSPSVDPLNVQFGNSVVLISNGSEFLKRVRDAARAAGSELIAGFVRYNGPDSYTGPTGPFWKSSNFDYQREYRLVAVPGWNSAIKLQLDNLHDVTTDIFPSSYINSLVFNR